MSGCREFILSTRSCLSCYHEYINRFLEKQLTCYHLLLSVKPTLDLVGLNYLAIFNSPRNLCPTFYNYCWCFGLLTPRHFSMHMYFLSKLELNNTYCLGTYFVFLIYYIFWTSLCINKLTFTTFLKISEQNLLF